MWWATGAWGGVAWPVTRRTVPAGWGGGVDVTGPELHCLIAEARAKRRGAICGARARWRQWLLSAQPSAGSSVSTDAGAVALKILSTPHFNTSWAVHS